MVPGRSMLRWIDLHRHRCSFRVLPRHGGNVISECLSRQWWQRNSLCRIARVAAARRTRVGKMVSGSDVLVHRIGVSKCGSATEEGGGE